ncbi:MAG: DNA mismatch repair endonuclease MutL [Acidobacteria bacterium]|nr:DNA mismatch repair endonuclease MutL [Acidobacteriota bacterium]
MTKIRVLPDIVANRIAAGEVVERPESVVKELIENALDAGATSIRVMLKNGGKLNVTVIDNGCGMGYDDAMLAFERHATSKISTEQDLLGVATLGFRGEALPSIASVSRLRLSTCQKGESEGTILSMEGGVLKKVVRGPLEPGTTIEIGSLFFNVPARKKFLKTVETEYGRVARMVTSYALANPDVSFFLTHNGKQTFAFSERLGLADRARQVLGEDPALADLTEPGIEVSVFLLPPEHNLRSPLKQFFLLNGRFIRDKTVSGGMLSAYRQSAAHIEGYPQVIIKLTVAPEMVDVNVHPSKLEVRFRHQSDVYNAVKTCCLNALFSRHQAPSVFYQQGRERLGTYPPQLSDWQNNSPTGNSPGPSFSRGWHVAEHVPATVSQLDGVSHESNPVVPAAFSVLAQFQETYILVEHEGELYIIDQHVAHERILFELALRNIWETGIAQNRLVIPETANVGEELLAVIQEHRQLIEKAGYMAEKVGEGVLKITASPVFVPNGQIAATLLELLAMIAEGREADVKSLYRDVAALIGCKAAIKANHSLGYAEMTRLIADLFQTENPYYCPHGRPVILKLTLSEIEKLFMRK